MADLWTFPSHQTVPWGHLDVFRFARTWRSQKGNPVDVTSLGVVSQALLSSEAMDILVKIADAGWQAILGGAAVWTVKRAVSRLVQGTGMNPRQMPAVSGRSDELFPFFRQCHLVVGRRNVHEVSWKRQFSPFEQAAITLLLDSFVSHLLRLVPKPPVKAERGVPDFSGHLIALGGPVDNWYTRNVMYDADGTLGLPYRFKLSVLDRNTELDYGELDPHELRAAVSGGQTVANWLIVDKTGKPANLKGEEAIPSLGSGAWRTDYFMIIKCPNIHPSAARGTSALIVAGCHGVGTLAGCLALKDPAALEVISNAVGRGYFQAIGRTLTRERGSVPTSVTVDLVQPLPEFAAIGRKPRDAV